jgi:hypothetical protein
MLVSCVMVVNDMDFGSRFAVLLIVLLSMVDVATDGGLTVWYLAEKKLSNARLTD